VLPKEIKVAKMTTTYDVFIRLKLDLNKNSELME
jgi:hypothetical protein